ncbi:hypothetical protein SERLADRAFT_472892 [Serpula lacrymans var. lacrymans S7.9]|nr:uncharacterized protein SERLADRAFT_472892 [Serpula lacrymans var. lacrymans S7.9]EGO22284.1 hypothetical protein SERLADRAFT_472892 [Serpula lacrymans var. lacrymans S7.9]
MRRQQRFSIGSWHGSSGRSNPVYLSGQHPSQHQGMGLPSSSSHVAMNRLPPDSTLLTPLPGYEPPAMIPGAMHGQPELDVYGGGGYDSVYEEDGRPGSGHSNVSGYTDGRMRRNVYGEDMRPNSSHSRNTHKDSIDGRRYTSTTSSSWSLA